MRLRREVRFCLADTVAGGPVLNSWAGGLSGGAIAPFIVLRAIVSGSVDEWTGYVCNITFIDRLLRDRAIPYLRQAWTESGGRDMSPARSTAALWELLEGHSPNGTRLECLELRPTPYQGYRAFRGELPMIVMTESFEFAASHRLCRPDFSEEQNRGVFGKCCNPNGHGHNYVLEVSVAGEPHPKTGAVVDHLAFQTTVKERVIDRFDHRHLNSDCPEFANLNPTLENITGVIWDLLAGRFAPARLHAVRVYETARTWAERSDGHESVDKRDSP